MKSIYLTTATAAIVLSGVFVVFTYSSDEKKNNPELGRVKWLRDMSDIQTRAKKTSKPVFLLFQEVPG